MATAEETHHKAAAHQALLREVNERVVALSAGRTPPDERVEVLCECFDRRCIEAISLTLREYEKIRESPVHFPVKPGHVLQDSERVVQTSDRYAVVEKLGEDGNLVAARHVRGGAHAA